MKLAVLGGRFDPPHLGHIKIAKEVIKLKPNIDKFLFMPVNMHNWVGSEASPKQRLEMLKKIVPEGTEVSDLEIKRGGKSYTIDTLKQLKEQNPKIKIYWIVGSDVLPLLNKWKNYEQLKDFATFIVYPRPGYPIPEKLPEGFEKLETNLFFNISSTEIRKRLKEGKSIKDLVPQEIEEYININRLYL